MHDPHPAAGAPSTAHTGAAAAEEFALFAGGPLLRLRSKLWLLRGKPYVGRRAVLFVLVAWFPLLVLTSLYGLEGKPVLRDMGTFARYVIAGPLLLIAEV